MRRLPSSPSRAQALIELEPVLLEVFQTATIHMNHEVRDAMHYVLFSAKDRFCASTAWLLAPRFGVTTARLTRAICAIEILRCSLEFRTRSNAGTLEPTLA